MWLADLLPHYPHPNDQPIEICSKGYRWFREEMKAVADAIYRGSKTPHPVEDTRQGADWNADIGSNGL